MDDGDRPVIKPPIFVSAHGDLLVFPTLAEAEAALVALTAGNGQSLVAYDRDGRLLRAQVRIEHRRRFVFFRQAVSRAALVETEHIPTHDSQLRSLLLRFIHPLVPAGSGGHSDPLEGLIRVAGEQGRAAGR
jgi:hypothetical protein